MKVTGPTGKKTNKYVTGRKHTIPRPSAEELVILLNESGPVKLSKKLKISKVTVHSWMNHYGIESFTQWKIADSIISKEKDSEDAEYSLNGYR